MESLNFDSYFENADKQYYDSKFTITVLENIFDTKFDDIISEVNSAQIIVTEEQITEFLEKNLKRKTQN